jgi:hypothetical protein
LFSTIVHTVYWIDVITIAAQAKTRLAKKHCEFETGEEGGESSKTIKFYLLCPNTPVRFFFPFSSIELSKRKVSVYRHQCTSTVVPVQSIKCLYCGLKTLVTIIIIVFLLVSFKNSLSFFSAIGT